jgi:hypothetical protein
MELFFRMETKKMLQNGYMKDMGVFIPKGEIVFCNKRGDLYTFLYCYNSTIMQIYTSIEGLI